MDRLCSRRDVPLRDKALFRMLYETSSRASAILQLNVEDLDLRNRSAVITQKGGHQIQVAWGDGTAAILGRLVAGRNSGPVFLTDLPAGPRRAAATKARDIDHDTSRTRLSYGRARALIERYTGGEITLHQLRHSSLTHLAEAGVGTTTLMAKSGHANLRSLQRYARPSFAAVQQATELLSDPPTRKG
nr:tyrosine-type recombinase/integrase [Mycolicibacter heraklionensis]